MTYKEQNTISTLLLLPLYLDSSVKLQDIVNFQNYIVGRDKNAFVNCYNTDINRPNYNKDALHLLFDFKLNSEYVNYSKKLMSLSNFMNDTYYEIDGKPYLDFTLSKLDETPQIDIDNIKNGNYSLITIQSKAKILAFWGNYVDIVSTILKLFETNTCEELDESIGENTYKKSFSKFANSLDELDIQML